VNEILLNPPRSASDQAINSILRAKFKAQTSVEETARKVISCEKRLSELCKLFNVTKEHCGIDLVGASQRTDDIQKVVTEKFEGDPRAIAEGKFKGVSLWPRWAQRQQHALDHPTRTLDRCEKRPPFFNENKETDHLRRQDRARQKEISNTRRFVSFRFVSFRFVSFHACRVDRERCARMAGKDGVKHSWYYVAEFETDRTKVSQGKIFKTTPVPAPSATFRSYLSSLQILQIVPVFRSICDTSFWRISGSR
jgi:hypothetical protein